MKTIEEGSITAKKGFQNEDFVVQKFNSWQQDLDAQQWLQIMNYCLNEIESVKAEKISGHYKPQKHQQHTKKQKTTKEVAECEQR